MISKEKDRAFPVGLILTILATCINFISFVSPFWIQSKPEKQSLFQNIGLWTACFTGYMLPDRYYKAYFGCWYIYYIEYDEIRTWINPRKLIFIKVDICLAWLYAIQILSSLGMLVHGIVSFVLICQICDTIPWNSLRYMRLHILALTNICAIVAFTVASHDSRWMPFPEYNMLSWSYGLAYISLIFSIAAIIAFLVLYLRTEPAIGEEYFDVYLEEQPKQQEDQNPTNEFEMLPKYRPEWSRNRSTQNNEVDYIGDQHRLISPNKNGSEIYDPQSEGQYNRGVYLGAPPSEMSL